MSSLFIPGTSTQTSGGVILTDPMERLIADALNYAKIKYITDQEAASPAQLDFYLPDFDIHIEVKQMHSDRIGAQMSRADNVIVAQGATAVRWLASVILTGDFR